MGEDKAGIVARTARLIASVGGNVLELNSHVRRAASTGTPLYEMDMRFDLPPSVDIEALRRKTEEIENELHIEVDLNLV
jgi:glycine cleavage system regulatory protein